MIGLLYAWMSIADAGERLALVVGSNAAIHQRSALRYAHRDADNMAAALRDLGDFDGVRVMYDPEPHEVLSALDQDLERAGNAGEDSLVLFYYSGHADQQALYPGGQPLSVVDLKQRLDDDGQASVRLGVVDACSGGGWTGAKGLTPIPVFDVAVPDSLDSEGMALIASSSGSEVAHEAEVIEGSFFTHHLVVGLRGAADQDHDGQVSLREAFQHAQRGTVQASALYAEQTQTPSFDLHLRGKQDLVLTRLDRAPSILTLQQDQGPVEVVHLATGVVVLRMEPGQREIVLALPPGSYVVRRRDPSGTNHASQVELGIGQRLSLAESQLTLVLEPSLESKHVTPKRTTPDPMMPILPQGGFRARLTSSDLRPNAYTPDGVSTRWWPIPSLAYGISKRVNLVSPLMVAGQVSTSVDAKKEHFVWGGNDSFTTVWPTIGIDRVRTRANGLSGRHLFLWTDLTGLPVVTSLLKKSETNLRPGLTAAVTRTVRWGRWLRIDVPFNASLTKETSQAGVFNHLLIGMGDVTRAGTEVYLLNVDIHENVSLVGAPTAVMVIPIYGFKETPIAHIPRLPGSIRAAIEIGVEGRF
jgi:uncharacterized caspase-like protein